MIIKSKKNKLMVLSCFLLIFLIVPIFTNNINANNVNGTLKTSTDNKLFNGKEYDITLDDVYDDENNTKIYTGANFQSVFLENESIILNETVSPVNNTNYKSPSDTDVSMIDGTFDDTDNMKTNDNVYSVFTSTEGECYDATYTFDTDAVGAAPAGWTDADGAGTESSVIAYLDGHRKVLEQEDNNVATYARLWQLFTAGAQTTGTIEFWMRSEDVTINSYFIPMSAGGLTLMEVSFFGGDITAYNGGGRTVIIANPDNDKWYHIRIDFRSNAGGAYEGLAVETYWVYVDEVKYGPYGFCNGRNDAVARLQMMTLPGGAGWSCFWDAIGYLWDGGYSIGDNLIVPPISELNYTVDIDFSEVDPSKLLALDVSSYHYTNISTDIIGSIYNYDSSSYTQMFSSSNTVETLNYFMNDTIPADYLNPSGNLRLYFTGINDDNTFKQIIDYIRIRFYYKMDLTHTISFETNGLWKYRWVLFGSISYTDWTFFEVVDPVPNFHAISESDITTRWILQNASITAVEDFHDDISTNYWNLIETSNIDFDYQITTTADAYVGNLEGSDNNYGSLNYMKTEWTAGPSGYKNRVHVYFPDLEPNYLFTNQTGLNLLGLHVQYTDYDGDVYCNDTSSFSESTITWNNAPVGITLQDTTYVSGSGYKYWEISDLDGYYVLYTIESGVDRIHALYLSKEYGSNSPTFFRNDISKNYFGSGYMYMQTDTTETIGLKSPDYGTHKTLSSGDYFEVDFQTSSDSQIDLILLKDGVVNKTLTLSQSGNTNFDRHTVQISVSEELEFDQLKISSTFEDTDNVKVYDIKTKKYTLVGDYADFRVGPKNDFFIYLTPSTYNLRIFDPHDADVKININITIGSSEYNFYTYQPTSGFQCRLTLHSTEGLPLDITDFHIWVNRSNRGSYSDFDLLDNTFNVDEGTMIYFEILDRFDNLIDEFQQVASDYIDLELEVYQLKIINLMEQQTTVDINSTQIFPIVSGELIKYILSKNYYEIGYYDMDNDYHQFIIYLNSNQAFELNRSKICFLSYADQRGNHLSFDNYKTYINGSMIYQQIFYEDAGDDVNITITDRYDYQVYSSIYSVDSGDNFIPITLTMYSLKLMNQQEVFNHINITRDPNYYDSEYYWSEWIAPNEIVEFKLFAGHYVFNLTDTENGYSSYEYELNGDDVLLMSSDNIISNVIYNIANVNTTIGNQITNVQIDLTNQNSDINNTIINIDINLSNVNSSLGTLLTNINLDITNINNNISNLFTFTENNFLNLGNNINNSFILIENNIIAINQTISTLVIGLDGKVTIVNATINTMFTEMNSQFIITQSTLDFSFAFLNQTIVQIGNNITTNQIALNNLIIQRANDIDNSLIQISTLVNLINSSVVNESLVIQSLVNIIGNNITENHVIINDLINLIGNNITENNVNMINIIELVGNNITTNHFVIQTLIDYVSNNISDNHLEVLTNINFINTTIGQNQIELINRLLFINNSINDMALDLTNQILLVNNTIYSAILDVSVSIDFNSDNILGNISLTYQQNDFLTELYKETMFSQLLNWSGVAFNYSSMESRIDVWSFINDYKNESITVFLRYNEIIDNLTISAQNTIEQYLPNEDVEYRLWSITNEKYLSDWVALPENKTVNFGFFEEIIPEIPDFDVDDIWLQVIIIIVMFSCIIGFISYIAIRVSRRNKSNKKKLYKFINRGRDVEAEYYGKKETPF